MPSLSRRRLLHLSGGLAVAAATPAIARPETNADLSGDVALLRDAFTAIHPAIYRHATPDQVAARFDAFGAEWARPGSFSDRLASLSRLTAQVRCGHTFPNPYNQTRATRDRIYAGRRLVPFEFLWLAGAMVVTRDRSPEGAFARGDTIVAINGVSSTALLARLTPLSRADGAADAKRVSNMQMRGDKQFESFDLHLPLVLPDLAERAVFTLADGRRIDVGLFTLGDRQASLSAATSDNAINPWGLSREPDDIVRMTFPTWAVYNATWDWRSWLTSAMDDLAVSGARGLIIDLRGNEGGLSECGDIILSRLTRFRVTGPRAERFVRYRSVPQHLNAWLDTWDDGFRDWGDRAVGPDGNGFYRLTDEDAEDAGIIAPQGRRFGGPVMVLCDASNSSATFGFAQAVKDNGLATLIGPATGGSRQGTNGGYFFLRLPASGLEVDLPHTAILPRSPQPDLPVQPDVQIDFTPADIAAGRDPQMAAAIARILAA